ncbi:MAG: hypothetical protein ACRDAM_17390 [Casimicrobium sp.]
MRALLCVSALATLLFANASFAQTAVAPISAPVEQAFQRVLAAPLVKSALTAIEADDERTLREQIELTEIPAPPFKEAVKAAEFLKRVRALGLADSKIDSEGNVIAVRKGVGNGSTLVVSAHLDTVFP